MHGVTRLAATTCYPAYEIMQWPEVPLLHSYSWLFSTTFCRCLRLPYTACRMQPTSDPQHLELEHDGGDNRNACCSDTLQVCLSHKGQQATYPASYVFP